MKKITLFILALIFTTYQVRAQLAMLNGQKVMASMPAFAKTDSLIAKETAGYSAEYNKKQLVLNQLVKVADSLYKLDSKANATIKAVSDVQVADKELKTFADAANKKLADYKLLLQKPYIDKVMAAIKAVAVRGKYMQVLDIAAISVLYLNPLTDITDQVIKELKVN